MSTTMIISISIYMVINVFLTGVSVGQMDEITYKERLFILFGLFFMLPVMIIHIIFPSSNKLKNLIVDIWKVYFTHEMSNLTESEISNIKEILDRAKNKKDIYSKIRVRLINVVLNRNQNPSTK